MAKLVTVYGGSGFVGRYVVRRLAKQGWRVRVAVRRPNEAMFVKPYGTVGQVEPVFCNIRDAASVRTAMRGADAVVNCVGILADAGKNRFEPVQHEGAERIARAAAEAGVKRLVHLSAIGADADSVSRYVRSKALGEAAVLRHFRNAVVLRPSIVFGPEDQFFNRFAAMARFGPILPLVGGGTRFQPVYVDDVAQAAAMAVTGAAAPGVYQLGGPDIRTFRELMQQMLAVIQRRRLLIDVPFWMARILATVLDGLQAATLGLVPNIAITRDQVENLRHDCVVGKNAKTLADLGIVPTALEAVLPEYLWSFRPSGQYAAIKQSAKNLRT